MGISFLKLAMTYFPSSLPSKQLASKQVSSALKALTSVFGMRTGVAPSLISPVMVKCLQYTHNYINILLSISSPKICVFSLYEIKPSTYQYQSTTYITTLPSLAYLPCRLQGVLLTLGYGISNLGAGFTLRCFQHLSIPYFATLPCHWRDNRCTIGTFTPVLSY